MPTKIYKTPGVYIQEPAAFPPSVVGVQTAVPVFIGYTEKATQNGKSVQNKAIPIGSLADYVAIFGGDAPSIFELNQVTDPIAINSGKFDFTVVDDKAETKYYALNQISETESYFYNSLRLFYANGGGNAFVISVGSYTDKVVESALMTGLGVAHDLVGPTMLVIPDAVLLASSQDFQKVVGGMLTQCQELQDRVAIFDVYGVGKATQDTWAGLIDQFREDIGETALSYGMAYFPFLQSTVVSASEFTFQAIQNLDVLKQILGWEISRLYTGSRADAVRRDADAMAPPPADPTILNQNLVAALPLLGQIEAMLAQKNNLLPASGAMAGVYTRVDGDRGVWNAPANVVLSSVLRPSLLINNDQQAELNLPVNGKAVNAIREFLGRGTVVWGARTLDGNSPDHRYIQVRRTLIYIEQSIKAALDPFVFAPNSGNTWSTVVAMVSGFLTQLWSQGGLMGATASEAFSVQCGLGSTMTGQDILDGYMIVQVTVQMIRPAEFIELNFKQKMEGVA